MSKLITEKQVVKVSGVLRELTVIKDSSGKILHKILTPLRIQFRIKDILEIVIGSMLIAIPIAFTQEAWMISEELPMINILAIAGVSILMVAVFVYFKYYQGVLLQHPFEFLKRLFFTYAISLLVAMFLMTLIEKAPWDTDMILAWKRTIIVALPASLSGSIADTLR